MQLYKDSIAQKIVTILEEDLKDPPLAIVGPALKRRNTILKKRP